MSKKGISGVTTTSSQQPDAVDRFIHRMDEYLINTRGTALRHHPEVVQDLIEVAGVLKEARKYNIL